MFEKRDEDGSESTSSSSDDGGGGFVDEDSRPVLVCMTFADRLLAEMMVDGKYDQVTAKRKIENHFKVNLLYPISLCIIGAPITRHLSCFIRIQYFKLAWCEHIHQQC